MFVPCRPPRRTHRARQFLLAILAVAACADSSVDEMPTAKDTGADRDTADTADTGDAADTGVNAPLCADGKAPPVADDGDAVWVAADGDDANDGVSAPVASLTAAVGLARSGGIRVIAVGPGVFVGTVELSGSSGDDALSIGGCSASETILEPTDTTSPVVKATGVDALVLRDVGLEGGRRALWIWQGGSALVQGVEITNSQRTAILIDGTAGLPTVSLVDTIVDTVVVDGGTSSFAYGLSVNLANVSMEGGGIRAATGAGILLSGVTTELSGGGFYVEATSVTTAGTFGRGIQVQDLAVLEIADDVRLADNTDAGLYAVNFQYVGLSGVTVADTAAGLVDGEATGDGIVLVVGDVAGDPALYPASLTSCAITGSRRSGVLASGVQLDASGNTISGSGYAYEGILLQDGAQSVGTDGATDLDAVGESLKFLLDLAPVDELKD